jgi:hypothetical protein
VNAGRAPKTRFLLFALKCGLQNILGGHAMLVQLTGDQAVLNLDPQENLRVHRLSHTAV